jgi:hypothetical protein
MTRQKHCLGVACLEKNKLSQNVMMGLFVIKKVIRYHICNSKFSKHLAVVY